MRRILFLGTGAGMPVQSACNCMLVEDDKSSILLDVAGGHDLFGKFHQAGKDPASINNIFITHYDSDHILGLFPLMRVFKRRDSASPSVNIFCSEEVRDAIESVFQIVANQHYEAARGKLNFCVVKDGTEVDLNGWGVRFFDVRSNSTPLLGCNITFADGKRLAYLGDEPFREDYADAVRDVDVLVHEAMCLHPERDTFEPYEKGHGTVMEAAINATSIGAKTLVLIHMEDRTLSTRKERYAKEHFNGDVFVPVDLDEFKF